MPDVERVERRRGGRPAGRALRRVARGDRPADDGALRHAPRGAAAGRAGRRPLRVASSRAPRDRRGGGRKRAAPRGRRVRACARRARDRRTRVGGRLRGGPRSRPCGWRRDGDAGGLRRLDHGRGRPRADDRAVSHGRHELACSVLDGVAPRGRRRSPHAGRNRPAAHRARGALGRRRPHLASDRRTAGSDLRARRHRRKLGRHAPRAPGSELDRSGPRRGARPLRRDPHTPLRRAARRPRRRAADRGGLRSSAPRRAPCCSHSRDRSRSRRWARSFSGSSRACPSPSSSRPHNALARTRPGRRSRSSTPAASSPSWSARRSPGSRSGCPATAASHSPPSLRSAPARCWSCAAPTCRRASEDNRRSASERRRARHGPELRRHRPARPAVHPLPRAHPTRGGERLPLRLDVRLARALAGVVPAPDDGRAGDDDDEVRALRDEPGHARADRARERLRDAARHLRRPHGHGHRPRRLGAALHRPEARPRRGVRATLPDDQGLHERPRGGVERQGAEARVGAAGAAGDPDVGRGLRPEGARGRGPRRRRRDHPARRPGDHPVDHGHRPRGGGRGGPRSRRSSSASSARRATSRTTSPTRASRCAGSRRWSRTTSWT